MKLSFLVLAAVSTASVVVGDQTSTVKPGLCLKAKDCDTYGPGFDCIAVESNRKGLEKLSMCVPKGATCSGSQVGICPTFGSWSTNYQKVMPVCAFQKVENCYNPTKVDTVVTSEHGSSTGSKGSSTSAPTSTPSPTPKATNKTTSGSGKGGNTSISFAVAVGDGSKAGSGNGTVDCYQRNISYGGNFTVVKGIYKCLDVKNYKEANGGYFTNLTATQILACGGNQTSGDLVLCNRQGTCAPKVPFSDEYACKCNKGFDSDEFCSATTSNECSNLGQCGASGTCTLDSGKTSGTCKCKNGSKGDQCNECDPSKGKSACNDNGKCSSDTGKCTCDSGYSGTFCQLVQSSTSGSSTTASSQAPTLTASACWATAVAVIASLLATYLCRSA
ncbi:TPA: hypothetical protein N0F65_012575 [Lagenidium giganteum]|uniref:EGF-like domain-containing protein n=1 Tax=Lagenidium giganteum TaxID=4803 RepID=A0AAV2YQZ5_9STRA|nr:TPA: hypothetical protein N0F65_012575 [Lagenidium giganteum]